MGVASGSLTSLREGNRKRVIDALRERGTASRADLARITGLSRSTVSTIVAGLLDSGLVSERDGKRDGRDGAHESHAGRPPVMVRPEIVTVEFVANSRSNTRSPMPLSPPALTVVFEAPAPVMVTS